MKAAKYIAILLALALALAFYIGLSPRGSGAAVGPESRGVEASERPEGGVPTLAVEGAPRQALASEPTEVAAVEAMAPCTIGGVVLDDLEQRLGQGQVGVFDMEETLVAQVAVDRLGVFEVHVQPGRYQVMLSGQGLPEGFMPPRPTRILRARSQSKYEGQVVEVSELNPVADVTLHAFKSAIVWGYVVDQWGAPIEGAYLFLEYAGVDYHPPGARGEARSDAAGYFEMVMSLPGNYRLMVDALRLVEGYEGSTIPPATVELSIEGGGVYPVGTLRTGGDGVVLTGRIINQDGEPFVGDRVACMPYGEAKEGWRHYPLAWQFAWGETDEQGVFRIEDLPASYLRIDLADDWEESFGTRRVATWWKPYYIDLRGLAPGTVYDMGTEFIPESRPYYMDIHFDVDRAWLARHGVDDPLAVFDCKTRLVPPVPSLDGLSVEEMYEIFGGGGGSKLDEETLILHYYGEPPPQPRDLRVIVESRGRKAEFEDFEVIFTPYQGGREELTIHIPPR